jgi:hypothetical protein
VDSKRKDVTMLNQHHITSARYKEPEPQGGYPADAEVIAIRNGVEEHRCANDDIEGGGMLAFLAGGGTIDPYQPPPITPEDVQAERARRLALGFSYDFEDARGVHQIGTTPADMVGWRDVIDLANALIDLGDTTTTISIVTDTGPTQVTAPEWQAVMLRAAEVRQVLWASSFALQAMDPIPEDYDADGYWT